MQPLFLRKTMLRISLTVFFLLVSFLYSFTGLGEGASAVPEVKSMAKPDRCAELFREMQLEGEVNYTAFRQAVTGYYRIAQRKKEILTLISGKERLFVDTRRTGERYKRSRPRTCHRSTWSCLCRSFRHSCRGEARKKFRMSCRSAKTFPAAYRYYQRRKCDVYLCCYSRVSCTEPYPELQRPCLTTLW